MRTMRPKPLSYERRRPDHERERSLLPTLANGWSWREHLTIFVIIVVLIGVLVPIVQKVRAEAAKAAAMQPPPRPTTTIVYPPTAGE